MTGSNEAGIDDIDRLSACLESIVPETSTACQRPQSRTVDAIITGWEVNPKHGSAVTLIQHFGGESDVLSIRSVDFFAGQQDFGIPLKIAHRNAGRGGVFTQVGEALRDFTVRRILYIPFRPDDLDNAIAVQAI